MSCGIAECIDTFILNAKFLGLLRTIGASERLIPIEQVVEGSELPAASDIAVPLEFGYMIDQLRERLPAGSPEFLLALVDALNDRAKIPALDAFPEWRDQPPVPLDAPWLES